MTGFTWVVILVTTVGVVLSFTPLRKLEGAGASRVGSLFLYLLVMTIGARPTSGGCWTPPRWWPWAWCGWRSTRASCC